LNRLYEFKFRSWKIGFVIYESNLLSRAFHIHALAAQAQVLAGLGLADDGGYGKRIVRLIEPGRPAYRSPHQMRLQTQGWVVGPLERQSWGSGPVLWEVGAVAGVVAVLVVRCVVISQSGRLMHQISGGGGRMIVRGGS